MGFKLGNIDGRSALVRNNDYYDLETISDGEVSSIGIEAIQSEDLLSDLYSKLDSFEATGNIDDVTLGAPITSSINCFAVGLNYRNHAEESGMEIPAFPMIFTKHTSCIVGPFDNVEMRSDIVDYEAEMVVVIGKGGKDIAKDDAWSHVAGITVGQDISDRSVQFHATPPQFNLGKSFDTFGPIGPILVSHDEVDDKESLKLTCSVNDELRQDDNIKSPVLRVINSDI